MEVNNVSQLNAAQTQRMPVQKVEPREKPRTETIEAKLLEKHNETVQKKAEKTEQQLDEPAMVMKAVNDANKLLRDSKHQLQYSVHEKTNTIMVKVIDTDTKEVIREIPPEKTLDVMAKIWELAGVFFDEKK